MAGMACPKCGQLTFFETARGRKCTKCGYQAIVPIRNQDGISSGGKGKQCSICRKHTVFNGRCTNYGTKYE